LAREAAGGELGSGEWRAPEDDASGFCSSELESVGEEDVREGRLIAKHAKLRPTSAKAALHLQKQAAPVHHTATTGAGAG